MIKWNKLLMTTAALSLLTACGEEDSAAEPDDAETEEVVDESEEGIESVDEAEEEPEEAEEPEVIAEEEPEEAEVIAEEEPEEEPDEELPYELIDDIALFTDDSNSIVTVGWHVDSFSYEMAQLLRKHHDELTDGAVFRSVKPLVDSYGNEESYNVIVVYYSQETIEKINYDNWPTLDASGLYSTADAVFAHPAYREKGASENIKGSADAPSLYNSLLGTAVED